MLRCVHKGVLPSPHADIFRSANAVFRAPFILTAELVEVVRNNIAGFHVLEKTIEGKSKEEYKIKKIRQD
jgi:hypothetical protein